MVLGIPSWYERESWFVDVITQNVKFGVKFGLWTSLLKNGFYLKRIA